MYLNSIENVSAFELQNLNMHKIIILICQTCIYETGQIPVIVK